MNLVKKGLTSASLASSAVACVFVFAAIVFAQSGWTIPADAANEKNPLTLSPRVIEEGKDQFGLHCEKCHGKKGLGDGPDVDRRDRRNRPANLAMSRNPDGVMFYKIWNGRHDPRMPAFKSEMTREEVWQTIAYITSSLRSK
jgi:mono/diheme cytochrome c family protein